MNLKQGDTVMIGHIEEDGLDFLSGKPGIITQVMDSPVRRVRGYIVKVAGLHTDENEWFVECKYLTKTDRSEAV